VWIKRGFREMPVNRKLGRAGDQRKALLRGLVTALFESGRIETTEARAKEVRSIVEKLITVAIKEVDKKAFNDVVDEYLQKLEDIIENKKTNIDQPIRYKIINLIDKSKNNWEKSKFEKSIEAKGKKDLEEEEELEKIDKGKATKKLYDKDEIIGQISSDLINFRDHILEEEGKPSDYDWEIIESIYKEHGNSVADMIEGYLYSCADFVQDDKTLKLAKDYFKELIYYYKDSLLSKEKKDIM